MNRNITPMAAGVNLSDSWNQFWGAVQGPAAPLLNLVKIVGVALVVMAFAKWAWDRRRRGGAGDSSGIWAALLIGALMSAPGVIIPMVLRIFDIVVNASISIWNNSAG
jgi:hypothetical protein